MAAMNNVPRGAIRATLLRALLQLESGPADGQNCKSGVPESESRRIHEMLSCGAKLQRNLNLEEYKRSQSRSGG
jgi:hypothetical protein